MKRSTNVHMQHHWWHNFVTCKVVITSDHTNAYLLNWRPLLVYSIIHWIIHLHRGNSIFIHIDSINRISTFQDRRNIKLLVIIFIQSILLSLLGEENNQGQVRALIVIESLKIVTMSMDRTWISVLDLETCQNSNRTMMWNHGKVIVWDDLIIHYPMD